MSLNKLEVLPLQGHSDEDKMKFKRMSIHFPKEIRHQG